MNNILTIFSKDRKRYKFFVSQLRDLLENGICNDGMMDFLSGQKQKSKSIYDISSNKSSNKIIQSMSLLNSPQMKKNLYSSQFLTEDTLSLRKSPNLQSPNNYNSPANAYHSGKLPEISQSQNKSKQEKNENISIRLSKKLLDKMRKPTPQQMLPQYDIKLTKQENDILSLSPSLQKFRVHYKLTERKQQIRHVNTLKKIKKAATNLGCHVRAKSSGIQLQTKTQGQIKSEQTNNYSYSKQFDRYFRSKVVQRIKTCNNECKSINFTRDSHEQQLKDTVKASKMMEDYRPYPLKRMENSLKIVANQKRQLPFFVKKQLDDTFQHIKNLQGEHQLKMNKMVSEKSEGSEGQNYSSPETSPKQRRTSFDEGLSPNRISKNTNSSKWSELLNEYQEDVLEFFQICHFFKKIQHELLRYLPNNHLSNKIETIFNQVQNGEIIRKIYDKCNTNIKSLTAKKIVGYLKKEEGLLSIMNYIVNVIKLNISAERRKRFKDTQKIISKFQSLIQHRAVGICNNLKNIDKSAIKKNIMSTLQSTDINCLALNTTYLDFVNKAEKQEFSEKGVHKRRKFICDLLKYEALMD